MNPQDPSDDSRGQLRRRIYAVMIVVGVGAMLGRVLAVDAVDRGGVQEYRIRAALNSKEDQLRKQGLSEEQIAQRLSKEDEALRKKINLRRPLLSANDRSRFCTVRALVEENMRVEGAPYAIDKVIQQANWDTIDMVKHDGHLYSSKPPLLATLMAGEYWLICKLTGATLQSDPFAVARAMIVTFNVLPMIAYFVVLALLVERLGTTDWGRLFVMAAAVFGTFLTTFAVTVNNHLPAAACAVITLYAAVRIWLDGDQRWRWFVLAGFFGAMTVANELPGAALLVPLSLALLWKAPTRTLLGFLPPVVLLAAAYLGTNWIAFHTLSPAYAHRGGGGENDWYDFTYERGGKVIESYWNNPVGVDRGEPSRAVYALHCLVGHHGIFSLTPVWILSAVGTILWLLPGRDRRLRLLALLVGAVTLACLAFYLSRPLIDRNYGGMTSGLRWVFWLAPLWLVVMLPTADALAARWWTRGLALLALGVSVLSACYPTWNPWTHPWLMDFFEYAGWI